MKTHRIRAPRAAFNLAGVVCIMAAGAGAAQESGDVSPQNDPVLARRLDSVIAKHKLPGMACAILHRQRVLAVAAAGVRKSGSPDPVTVGDQFHMGSNTKAMTATVIGMLVEEEKLAWDSAVGTVLPELKESIHEAYHAVTLRQLLVHRGGLPANSRLMMQYSQADQRRDLLQRALAAAPQSKPGSKFGYSNLGYVLAGLMAEKAGGASWEELMQKRLLEPLAMKSAGFGPPGTKGTIDQPWGHRKTLIFRHQPLQGDNPPVLGPAGTLHCSLSDWARFGSLHLNHAPKGVRLLSDATIGYLHQAPQGQSYALGWDVVQPAWTRGSALAHSGSNTIWFCTVYLVPDRSAGFFAATNSGQSSARQACLETVKFLSEELDRRLAP